MKLQHANNLQKQKKFNLTFSKQFKRILQRNRKKVRLSIVGIMETNMKYQESADFILNLSFGFIN